MKHFILIKSEGKKMGNRLKIDTDDLIAEGFVFINPKIVDKMAATSIIVVKYTDINTPSIYNSMETVRTDFPDTLIQFLK